MKKYLILTAVISILVGIILPLALGAKDLTLIAISFCLVWFVYVVLLLIYLPDQTWPKNQHKPSEWDNSG